MKGWDGGVELGLNGSSGNSEVFNFRGAMTAKRKVKLYETSGSLTYTFVKQDSEATENRAILDLRNDWLLENSKWRVFALGSVVYDDFKDWDFRVSAFVGAGYEFIENDKTLLLGRVGLGASREIGGTDNNITPEGLLGLDFNHKINERQRFTSSVDLFPALDDFGEYRAVAKAAWELIVDPETKMSLKIGVEDRFDSTPGDGFKKNDFSYFALLVWSF